MNEKEGAGLTGQRSRRAQAAVAGPVKERERGSTCSRLQFLCFSLCSAQRLARAPLSCFVLSAHSLCSLLLVGRRLTPFFTRGRGSLFL